MVIESKGKRNPHYEKNCQHSLLVQVREEQAQKVNDQDAGLSRNHVRHDRAHEKPFLAFEDHFAGGAMRFDIEGFLEN
jgi:hypothetical protein